MGGLVKAPGLAGTVPAFHTVRDWLTKTLPIGSRRIEIVADAVAPARQPPDLVTWPARFRECARLPTWWMPNRAMSPTWSAAPPRGTAGIRRGSPGTAG